MQIGLKFKILVLLCLSTNILLASSEYDWDGSTSTAWTTTSNWSPNPGSQGQQQVYNVGDPSGWDASNSPIISAGNSYTIDGIQIFEGGDLTITGGTTSIDDDLYIYDGGELVISGGSLAVDNLYLIDASSFITVSGGTLNVQGDIFLGRESPDNGENNTNGSPIITLSSGYIYCDRLRYDDAEGDTPEISITGGRWDVGVGISSDGEGVDITMSDGIFDVDGDFDASDIDSDIDISGGEIFVEGDWSVGGTSSITGGRIVFDGTATQTITNAGGETFNTIEIDNSAAGGISLSSPITITDSLIFVDGVINGSVTNTVTINDNVDVTGGSAASHVNGYVTKIGNEAFDFPVGDGTDYMPISITAPSSTTDEFTATYVNSNPDGSYSTSSLGTGITRVSTLEYWILDRDNGSSNVSVTIPWNSSSLVTALASLRLARWNGSQWTDEGNGGTTGNTTAGTLTSNGTVTSFSPFTLGALGGGNPLPVTWLKFDALLEGDECSLEWATGSELNCEGFYVERASFTGEYDEIGYVNSDGIGGYSNENLFYSFVDRNPNQGNNYYRIRQVDFNGDYDYSEIRVVSYSKTSSLGWDINLTLNHQTNEFKIGTQEMSGQLDVSIYNVSGQMLYHAETVVSGGLAQFYFQKPTSGIYLINIVDKNNPAKKYVKRVYLSSY